MRAGQQCSFPHSQLQKQCCWVTQPCSSQHVCNSSLTMARVLCGLQKEWSPWHYPQTAPGRRKCHHWSASEESCRQEALTWLNCSSPTFWLAHPEEAAGGKGGCGGFPWGSTISAQREAAAVLHLTPFPGGKAAFKSFPPRYPRASGTQPWDITVWTSLSHFSQSTADLCELGCSVPQLFLRSLSLYTYFTPAYADT